MIRRKRSGERNSNDAFVFGRAPRWDMTADGQTFQLRRRHIIDGSDSGSRVLARPTEAGEAVEETYWAARQVVSFGDLRRAPMNWDDA